MKVSIEPCLDRGRKRLYHLFHHHGLFQSCLPGRRNLYQLHEHCTTSEHIIL
jgi:hypothetical protein